MADRTREGDGVLEPATSKSARPEAAVDLGALGGTRTPSLLIRRYIRTLSWPACQALTGLDVAQRCAVVVGIWRPCKAKIRPGRIKPAGGVVSSYGSAHRGHAPDAALTYVLRACALRCSWGPALIGRHPGEGSRSRDPASAHAD